MAFLGTKYHCAASHRVRWKGDGFFRFFFFFLSLFFSFPFFFSFFYSTTPHSTFFFLFLLSYFFIIPFFPLPLHHYFFIILIFPVKGPMIGLVLGHLLFSSKQLLFPLFSLPGAPPFSRFSFPSIAHWFPKNRFSDWQKNPGEKWRGTSFLDSFPSKINTLSQCHPARPILVLGTWDQQSWSNTQSFSRLSHKIIMRVGILSVSVNRAQHILISKWSPKHHQFSSPHFEAQFIG